MISVNHTYFLSGQNISTIEKIEFDTWDWSEYQSGSNGDSLVPIWSASLSGRSPGKTFYGDYKTHMGLVSDSQVIQFVAQLILGNTSTISFSDISETPYC